ncbi:Hypothetical predicted protein [Cloeon dipterum]|uniref:G-protein coupled receptors family 1 profile domain-containing protein n=1 Tax=Cloeon dipterum TaxID=197152 RepID=A0A8S1D116_9INSE|nr:Hypothetical predicted protein [Cloeon dipterum]
MTTHCSVQSANNVLLLHLGVVDSLLCIVFLLFSAPVLLRGPAAPAQGATAGPLCALHGFLFTLLHPVALWTVCGLNCDRYYAISAPLHYTSLVNTRKVAVFLAASWILAIAMAIPPLFITGPGYRYTEPSGCTLHFTAPLAPPPTVAIWYSGIYTLFTLLVPAALILGCNLKVLMIARYHRHRIASAIFEVTLSAQVTITHQRNPFYLQSQFKGRRAIVTVLQLLGSLLVLYFPYHGVTVWEAAASAISAANLTAEQAATEVEWQPQQSPGHVDPLVVYLAMALITCSPPINGFIYGVKSKALRKSFANFLRKQMTKSEVNHEIQARTPSACGSRRPSLTPLGQLLGRPPHQRRLSEVLLEPAGTRFALSPHRPRLLKRMATELSWRPTLLAAATSIDLDAKMRRSRSARDSIADMRHGLSCNTLQVPGNEQVVALPAPSRQQSPPKMRQSTSTASLLVQKVLLAPRSICASKTDRPRTPPPERVSPQILITRALSQDQPDSPSRQREQDQEQDDSSTAALIQTGGSSNPESLCGSSPSSRDESLNLDLEAGTLSLSRASHRVCYSLDDVSCGGHHAMAASPATSPTSTSQQPLSLPSVPVAQRNGNSSGSWLRNLIFARHLRETSSPSSRNLMSWPIRTDLSKRSVTKTKTKDTISLDMNIDSFDNHYNMLLHFYNKSNISMKARDLDEFLEFPTREFSGFEIATLVVYGIMFFTGVLGNILVCVVIAKEPSMHTATNLFLVSLALADIMIFFVEMPSEVYTDYFFGDVNWELGDTACILSYFLPEVATNASVLTILAFSVERYLAICHPLRSKAMSNLRRAVRIIAAIWLASLVCAIPYTLGSELVALKVSQPYFACRYESDAFLVSHYFVGIASSILFFAIPFTVLVVLYSRIAIVIRNRGNIGECRTLSPNTKSVIWMLAAVVFSFFLCWAPFHLHRIIYVNFQIDGYLKTIERDLYFTSGFTFYLSSTINPILYNLMSAKYRNAFKATLCNQKN